jgi:hypothetical protein
VIANVALVVALVLCGGLSLMLVSTRSQLRSMHAHHDALQEELTYSKNHLHQVEVRAVWAWGGRRVLLFVPVPRPSVRSARAATWPAPDSRGPVGRCSCRHAR